MINTTLTTTLSIIAIAIIIDGCGGSPSRSETVRTNSVERTNAGGEVRHDSTQTTEVAPDGSQSTDRTETTQTTTPAPRTPKITPWERSFLKWVA